jgi:hypothetical protein
MSFLVNTRMQPVKLIAKGGPIAKYQSLKQEIAIEPGLRTLEGPENKFYFHKIR